MSRFIIDKANLISWLKNLDQQVLAPVKEKNGYAFNVWDGESIPSEEYKNTLKTPKDLFFPQHETLLRYQKVKGERPRIEAPELANEERIIFGMRPCDAKSLYLIDKVFIGKDYVDPYYQARRANTLMVTLVCEKPSRACFCDDLLAKAGSDIQLVQLNDDQYLVEAITDKGKAVFQLSTYLDADEESLAKLKEIEAFKQEAASTGVAQKLENMFAHTIWSDIEEKCLNCGVCSFLCPTCHCFDITDDLKGEKVRTWDTCMFASFTKHGSGHNPRPTGKERMRQRIMHKFSYFPENNGEAACVGCGRCVENCPVNLDIREVLKAIKEVS
ncbi:4Fe-4S dicluster domain-containing protein [Desulfonispora thiosulfatigenes DSM 11270]|uniref:4Fe-4S dicluster domain-containing protein n=1 Tax=Desulfonispora thiosulfatigenes DSM 11270 TaxID=656914 RepID=A0A1W1VD97_DESTI|nr:4Fe-4S dicluster domain-containing protein [Desulfonispora thiosulfatigenes]SMB91295.1 4Fe-4S dicluster domain-containing protein [Desulfonispora thiosulfatigenes DSM 11270]